MLKIAGSEDRNVFAVVGDIGGSIADVATRIDIYTAYVPKATRWQVDLLTGDLAAREETRAAVTTLASLQKLTDRADTLSSPTSIDQGTSFAVATFRSERAEVMSGIDQMKSEVLEHIKGERVAVMGAVDAEVKAALVDVEQMRQQTFVDLEGLSNRVILKVAIMAAVMLVLAALLAAIVLRIRSTSDEGWSRVHSR
jgi:hypothetical protein